MSTKNNPGPFGDCYLKAEPNEPVFTLLGRDPTAAIVITFWRKLRVELGKDGEQVDQAADIARDMEAYARGLGKGAQIDQLLLAFEPDGDPT